MDYKNHKLMPNSRVRTSDGQYGKVIERGALLGFYFVKVKLASGKVKTYKNKDILSLTQQ